MNIYLIRHAEEGEGGGVSDLGQKQSGDLGRWFRDKDVDALYSSDRARAAETAAVVGPILNLEPQIIPSFEEVRELKPLESIVEAQDRAQAGLKFAIAENPNKNIAIVAHSKLIRQLLDKLDLREFIEGEDLPNTGVVVLDYQDGKFRLLDYAIVPDSNSRK